MVISPQKQGAKRDLIIAHEEARSKIIELQQAVKESAQHAQQPPEPAKEKGLLTGNMARHGPGQKKAEPSESKSTRDINLLGFRIFGKKLQQEAKPQLTSIYGASTLSYKDVEASGSSINIFTNREYISRRGMGRSKGQLSREAARGNRCVWHPWREAYAICAYCHRPFCFEDTIEFSKDYYCLEDIDSISQTYKEKVGASSNTTGTVSGILLMLAFLAFLYFANGQVFYVWQYVAHEGLPFFVTHINYSYAFALIEMTLMVMAFLTAFMIFLQSTKRFFTGSLICILLVALFSYRYTSTGTLYLGIVDALVFVAFVMLLYSRAATSTSSGNDELLSTAAVIDQNMLKWLNVGKF
jgi:hypothetical protein